MAEIGGGNRKSCSFTRNNPFAQDRRFNVSTPRRMRKIYKERLQVLVESVQSELGGLLTISPSDSGMQVIGWLPDGVDDVAVSAAAAARGLEITPLSSCYRGEAPHHGLLLGFACAPPPLLRKGVKDLASAIREVIEVSSQS